MDKMDGYDFADIIEAGAERGESLDSTLAVATVSALTDKLTSEPSKNIQSDNPPPAQYDLPPYEHSTQQLSANQFLEEAAKQADKEYDARWQSIKNDPAKFLNDCKSQNMNIIIESGRVNPAEAEKQAKVSCNMELTELKDCMDKPNADAHNCYDYVFNRGD